MTEADVPAWAAILVVALVAALLAFLQRAGLPTSSAESA